ncbi:hypothetical protein CLV84_1848 [Neolewinella xylanilytica]|uniref:CotH protein n=1 Tax=Neolewinella xylanilytica TaxID=1514080 RepID=A0A2S6IBI6_9BACT|nr:hypothetical protein [Neolewinella xylanilytica]PPK88874.1 hypothetical protein CLV84_1848 [Neolewinella xylanilytica]
MRNAFFLLLFCTGLLPAQSVFDLLYEDAPARTVAVMITIPLDSIDAHTPNELPGTIAFTDTAGRDQHLGVEVSLRGKFRRTRCSTPPLKLNFSKKELAGMGLVKHDKYKLVNGCYADSTASDLLLKEYLAYRAYAILSPNAHFRVQLLELTYRDAAGNQPDRTEYAFLIEDPDEMADRFGGKELDDADGLEADRYDPAAEATHAFFQYLIGNADWSLALQRNVKIVERPDGKLTPVAYDFDFSGWVGAPYASPNRQSGQQSIYHRVYLGYHQNERVLRDVSQEFRSHRRELMRLIQDFELLNKRERNQLLRYVTLYYDSLAVMTANTGTLLYDQLRGETAAVIPPGAKPQHFRSPARR